MDSPRGCGEGDGLGPFLSAPGRSDARGGGCDAGPEGRADQAPPWPPAEGGEWRVPRVWPGETVCILGGGPSLTAEQVEHVRARCRVVAVNNSWQLAPWADVLYACDATWWREHGNAPGFQGLKVTLDDSVPFRDVRVLKPRRLPNKDLRVNGLETDPGYLATGRNGAYQAVNFAVHAGASRIILLGVDCRDGKNGPHWHGKHPGRNPDQGTYSSWIAAWATMPAALPDGVTVVNCSPGSAVTAFPKARLEDVI